VRPLRWLSVLSLLPLLALLACAGAQSGGQSPDALKKAAQRFFHDIRWKDFASAASQLVPEKQDAFSRARRHAHDEKDLSITEYDLHEIKLAPDALSGQAIVSLSWVRIPSVTVESAEVETDFVYQDGQWRVKRMDGGPFEDLR
jgi:hypothetical protein